MQGIDYFAKMMREKMGIVDDKSNFNLDIKFDAPEWKDTLIPEMEIPADTEELIWTDNGVFYHGRRVILYIRDQVQYFGEGASSEYKFHITGCPTLKAMHTQHRYDKYVVSENTSGIFKINRIVNNIATEIETELHVCKHCLRALNWKSYRNLPPYSRIDVYREFSLAEFFRKMNDDNQRNFARIPEYTSATAPLNVYPENWNVISKTLRTEAGYICSDCHRKIRDARNLHVHHRNGIKNDCSRSNLEVLCVDCHQRRHNHRIGFAR